MTPATQASAGGSAGSDQTYFPDSNSWQTTTAAAAGLSDRSLAAALDYARSAASRQLIVLYRGRIVCEHYVDSSAEQAFDVYAIQKALFGWLLAIAQSRSLCSIDDSLTSLIGTGWSNAPGDFEARICLRHVLTMTTGLGDDLLPAGEVGQTWHYNNVVYNYAKRALCERAGIDLDTLTRQWLSEPLGLTHTRWVDRPTLLPDGRPITALLMTARDLARFGLAMSAQGCWQSRRVVPDPAFLRDTLTPGSLANPAWGYAWWINGQSHYMQALSSRVHQGAFAPRAPVDLYGARGALEQRLLVLPSRSLVVVRLGTKAPREAGNFDDEFLVRLLAADS